MNSTAVRVILKKNGDLQFGAADRVYGDGIFLQDASSSSVEWFLDYGERYDWTRCFQFKRGHQAVGSDLVVAEGLQDLSECVPATVSFESLILTKTRQKPE